MKRVLIVWSFTSLLCACGGKKEPVEVIATVSNESLVTLTDAQLTNAGITTGKMALKKITATLKVNGKIDVPPQNMVSISVPLGGYLKTTRLLPGMHINKGDVIAVMEDQQYIQLQQDYLTAKAKVSFLQHDYERQKVLNESKAASDKLYQLSEVDYRTQRVLISALSEKLKLAGINPAKISEASISSSVNIHSPINGYVSKVNVNIGKYVSATDVLFELINPTDIHLALTVFEKDLDKLFIGQKLLAYTNNQPGKKHPCEILLIGKDLSADGNTAVHCHFEDYDKSLVPGTYMNADIEVTSASVLVLPTDAIVSFDSKQYIYTVKGSRTFEMVEVQAGNNENGFTEIILPQNSSLGDADVVTVGAYALLMMMKNKAD